jgi:Na+-translocating ferredoxin:NAD+ oxidoreductase RnfE subunit
LSNVQSLILIEILVAGSIRFCIGRGKLKANTDAIFGEGVKKWKRETGKI